MTRQDPLRKFRFRPEVENARVCLGIAAVSNASGNRASGRRRRGCCRAML